MELILSKRKWRLLNAFPPCAPQQLGTKGCLLGSNVVGTTHEWEESTNAATASLATHIWTCLETSQPRPTSSTHADTKDPPPGQALHPRRKVKSTDHVSRRRLLSRVRSIFDDDETPPFGIACPPSTKAHVALKTTPTHKWCNKGHHNDPINQPCWIEIRLALGSGGNFIQGLAEQTMRAWM